MYYENIPRCTIVLNYNSVHRLTLLCIIDNSQYHNRFFMFVENITFEFYTLPDNKLYPELYVGMRTNVTVVAIYPVGVYKKATIKLKDRNPGQFFDVTDVSCKHGSSINSSNEYKIQDRRGLGVSIIFLPVIVFETSYLYYKFNRSGF